MGKKQDAASVKAEVEKQTAAIRRLATSLRAEASSGNWLANFGGRKDVLLGTAQTLDGIADALTFAVNHDTSALPRLNKAFRSAAGGLLFLVGGATGTIADETVKELDIPEAIAGAFTESHEMTRRAEQALAEAEAVGPSSASGPLHSDSDMPTDSDIPSNATAVGVLGKDEHEFDHEVEQLLHSVPLQTLIDVEADPSRIHVSTSIAHAETVFSVSIDGRSEAAGPPFLGYSTGTIPYTGHMRLAERNELRAEILQQISDFLAGVDDAYEQLDEAKEDERRPQ